MVSNIVIIGSHNYSLLCCERAIKDGGYKGGKIVLLYIYSFINISAIAA